MRAPYARASQRFDRQKRIDDAVDDQGEPAMTRRSDPIHESLHFKGTELIRTYTPFPVPYEFLPPELGLFDVPEAYLTGTITD